MPKKYHVDLTDDQRHALEARRTGPLTLRQRNRVDVLLRADGGETDDEIADSLGISAGTVANVRRRCAEEGPEAALAERPRRGAPAKLDGKQEAAIIALACSPTEDGFARWSVRRLSERAVALEVVESVSRETVRRLLKKAS
ncbi:helix-turn-helix domain-containing protein [Paludisphaera soli]|uniref:helix-turn-helix domain-containing protein n=1 Tax=Paludisphaera soli TaxID=2712865 RepID=UPI0013EC2166|nr:helix-turn-helix domain-containing protein [Paludisphaera soli]